MPGISRPIYEQNTPTAVLHIPKFGDAVSGAEDGQLSACGYIYTGR